MKDAIKDPLSGPGRDLYEHIFRNTGTTVFVLNDDFAISLTNLNGYEFCGFPESKFIGTKFWLECVNIEDRKRILYYLENVQMQNCLPTSCECRFLGPEQRLYYLELNISFIPNNSNIIISAIDITEKKEAEQALVKSKQLANFYEFHDHLTQLPNKELFQSRISMELNSSDRRKKIFAVICIGIDRLKAINEIYGPSNGDLVLKELGETLKTVYRKDDFICRFTGDKFLVLLSDLKSTSHVLPIVEKTLNIFTGPFPICGEEITITASIGVSIFPNDSDIAEEIIKNAETAMFIAKERKRGSYQLFNQEMHQQIEKKFRLTQEMFEGINSNQFIPYYQPKVDKEGRLAGMEALARWNNPHRGILLPVEFLGLAEENGMIIEIGYQILEKACKQILEWSDKGKPFFQVAVNLSPVQFRQDDLVDRIKEILNKTGMPSKYLELEITESGIIYNEDRAIERLSELINLGIDIAIDDFGTGYSSLYRLKDYPVTRLKIDKSFLKHIHTNKKTSTITTSIIQLAHKLGFQVIAEGIEQLSQFNLLKDHSCDYYQGFYFDKPLHPEDLEKNWLTNIA